MEGDARLSQLLESHPQAEAIPRLRLLALEICDPSAPSVSSQSHTYQHELLTKARYRTSKDMAGDRKTPVLVGVGDVVNRSRKVEDALEPLELMLRATRKSLEDTGLSPECQKQLLSEVDSLDIVRNWTWPYPDLPSLFAQRLPIQPRRQHYSDHGGNQPGHLFDEAARRISRGETKVAILTGGEALASRELSSSRRTDLH